MAEGRQKGRKPTFDEQHEMWDAIYENNVTKIENMITRDGIDVNAKLNELGLRRAEAERRGSTALHCAAGYNKLHIIKKLVELGADITITDYDNRTPLDIAVQYDSVDIIHFLLKECRQDTTKLKQETQQKLKGRKVRKYLEKREKILEKAFSLALRDGTAKALGIKLLLFGPEYVGKSCVSATLVGDPFQERSATEGADVSICNTTNWNKISSEEVLQRLQNEYLVSLKGSAECKTEDAQASIEANVFTKAIKSFAYLIKIQADQKPPKVDTNEFKEARATKSADIQKKGNIDVTILDFAGQTQYHNTHSVFIGKENVIMVIFNASQPLSKNVKVRSSTLKPEEMTNSQNIHFWMKTVHSVCREPGDENDKASLLPVILLVATHLDLLEGPIEEAKEKIIQELAKELEGKPYAQHLAGHREGLLNALRKYCIFLSNKNRDPVTILKLQNTIVEISLPILSREQPLVFLKVERELMGIEKGAITKKEFHTITQRCGFLVDSKSEEFAAALQYFHHRGTVLHFATIESLKELVILSPHWLTKLFSFVLIAHPYQRIGGKEDISFRILIDKGILVGSFLTYMLEAFNSSERKAGSEIERKQTIDLMKKFGFVAQVTPKAEFLEEANIANEKEIFIVPSLLPKDTTNKKEIPKVDNPNVRVVYFYFPDQFLPPILFDQMVTKCIDRNEFKSEAILWLRKGKVMMALSNGQCYCISLCEEKCSIQLSFVFLPEGDHLAEQRLKLMKYFQLNVEAVIEDFMNATSKPVAYIPCYYCKRLHVKFQSLFDKQQLHCPDSTKPIPLWYYCDLVSDEVLSTVEVQSATSSFDCSTAKNKVKAHYDMLTNLPIELILDRLLVKGVISPDEKKQLDCKPGSREKMIYILDSVITPSLVNGDSIKFKAFSEVLEQSGHSSMIDLAKQLGDLDQPTTPQPTKKSISIPVPGQNTIDESATITANDAPQSANPKISSSGEPDTHNKSEDGPAQSTTTQLTADDSDVHTEGLTPTDVTCPTKTEIFDCSTVQKNIKMNYDELTYLPINSMLGKLYSKEIITFKEKEMIESKPAQSERMVYFLDEIIIRSLAVNVDVKFRRFIEVMMESGDPTLTTMAAKLIK